MMKVHFEKSLIGHQAGIYCLTERGDSEHIFSGAGDGLIMGWSLTSGERLGYVINVGKPVLSLLCLSESNLLLAGQSEGNMHVIDLSEKKELRNLKFHSLGIFMLLKLPNQNMMIALGGDGVASVIDLEGFELKLSIPLSHTKLRCAAVSAERGLLYIGSSDGYIRIVETEYFNEVGTINAHERGVYVMQWIDEHTLITGGADGHLRFWGIDDSSLIQKQAIPAHNYAIYDIALSENHKYFATASRDKTVKVWERENLMQPVRLSRSGLQGHSHSVNAIIWDSIHNRIVSAGDDRNVIFWKIN